MSSELLRRFDRWLKCKLGNHDWTRMRAVDLEEGSWARHHKSGGTEPIDGCKVVERCKRCAAERRTGASVDMVERMGIPKTWEVDDDGR